MERRLSRKLNLIGDKIWEEFHPPARPLLSRARMNVVYFPYTVGGHVHTSNTDARTDSITILSPAKPQALTEKRHEARCSTHLPLRLTSGSGEVIPAVVENVSASGLFATADMRFSLLLPPPTGARFEVEFFLDDVEARQLLLEIVRVEKYDEYVIGLGCQFVQPPATWTAHLRAAVAFHLAAAHR